MVFHSGRFAVVHELAGCFCIWKKRRTGIAGDQDRNRSLAFNRPRHGTRDPQSPREGRYYAIFWMNVHARMPRRASNRRPYPLKCPVSPGERRARTDGKGPEAVRIGILPTFFLKNPFHHSIGPGKESGPICSDHCSRAGRMIPTS